MDGIMRYIYGKVLRDGWNISLTASLNKGELNYILIGLSKGNGDYSIYSHRVLITYYVDEERWKINRSSAFTDIINGSYERVNL